MKPEYTKLLTPAERAASMRLGALLKCAEHGIPPDKIDETIKTAGIDVSPGGIAKAVFLTAILGGVPLGVAAHAIGKRITGEKTKERELKEKIRFYREATRGLEQGLAQKAPIT